jgi:hypothetical protein
MTAGNAPLRRVLPGVPTSSLLSTISATNATTLQVAARTTWMSLLTN